VDEPYLFILTKNARTVCRAFFVIKKLWRCLVAEQAPVWIGVIRRKFHAGLAVTVLAEFFGGFFAVLLDDLMKFLMGIVHGQVGGGFVWSSPEYGHNDDPENDHDNIAFTH